MKIIKKLSSPQTVPQLLLTLASIPMVAVVGLVTYPFRKQIMAAQERKKKERWKEQAEQ